MNISFKKDINKSLMVIEKVPGFSANSFMMKMLCGNEIPGLLPVGYENLNGDYNLLYDISSRQAFSKIFETRKISFQQMKAFLFSLKGLLRTLEDYLLDADNIILKQECIFTDTEGETYLYCYYPYYHGDLILEIRELFTRMLSMVNYEDELAVRLVYELHSEVQNENFTIDNIMEAYRRVRGEEPGQRKEEERNSRELTPEMIEMPELPPERSFSEPLPEELLTEEDNSFFDRFRMYVKGRKLMDVLEDLNNGELLDKVRQCGSAKEVLPAYLPENSSPLFHKPELEYLEIGESFSLDNMVGEESPYYSGSRDGTVLLSRSGKENHRLVGKNAQQGTRFVIFHFPFTIGKKEGADNACLAAPTVSRMHARIYMEGDNYYIEDLNSTNGTFLNDQRLAAYTKTRLKEGDLLRFAQEEFCFQ